MGKNGQRLGQDAKSCGAVNAAKELAHKHERKTNKTKTQTGAPHIKRHSHQKLKAGNIKRRVTGPRDPKISYRSQKTLQDL